MSEGPSDLQQQSDAAEAPQGPQKPRCQRKTPRPRGCAADETQAPSVLGARSLRNSSHGILLVEPRFGSWPGLYRHPRFSFAESRVDTGNKAGHGGRRSRPLCRYRAPARYCDRCVNRLPPTLIERCGAPGRQLHILEPELVVYSARCLQRALAFICTTL